MSWPTSRSMSWSTYAALGDSLTAGRGDPGPDGRPVGWARRLAEILAARTAVPCALTNLAVDGATVTAVLSGQLPAAARLHPDLVSVTVGMNDIRAPDFSQLSFTASLQRLLDGLAATGATVLTCTLPDIAAVISLPPDLVEVAQQRMRQASDVIREQAAYRGVVCLDTWTRPDAADPGLFSPDRIHPNASGHRLIATAFADLLVPGPAPGSAAPGSAAPGSAAPGSAAPGSAAPGSADRGSVPRSGRCRPGDPPAR